jgi:hypothetical protein
MTVSRNHGFSPSDLFAAADHAQYVAKHGRLSSTVMADVFAPAPGSSA